MVKKLFALASVTALSGLVFSVTAAGCSSTTTVAGDPPDTGAGTDSGATKDSGPKKDSGPIEEEDSGPATCPNGEPVADSDLPWKNPTPLKANNCSQAQLDDFDKFLKDNPTTTNDQFFKYIADSRSNTTVATDSCGKCIVTDANAASWGPAPTSGGQLVTINIGACFSIVSGKVNCGKAIQNEFDCEFVACSDCTDDNSFNSCRTKSQKGSCKPYVQAIQTECAGVPATVDDQCGSFFDTIRVQCVGAGDAGDGGN